MAKFAVVIAAAGQSRRFNADGANSDPTSNAAPAKKPFATLKGKPVWTYSAELFAARSDVAQIVLIVSPEDVGVVKQIYEKELAQYRVDVVSGGAERFLSVENALRAVRDEIDYVAVHDAARPCVDPGDVDRVFAEAVRTDAAILAAPVVASLKRSCDMTVNGGVNAKLVAGSVSRDNLWEAQTPQTFEKELLQRAYRERPKELAPTDDCGLVEAHGRSVAIVSGSRRNIKITSYEDLKIAEKFLEIARDS